jgi:sugar lactone lactonase YvrE
MHGGNRTNDATTDLDGRLWFGTMDDGESEPHGRVYRYDGGITEMGGACTITNGPAISPDGHTLYHVDTLAGTIWQYALGDGDELGDGTVFAQIDPADGWPDGVTVDAEGCVWVGLWNGWAARRYDAEGKLVGEVAMPCANVTKVAFGGPGLKTGYITTARKGLSKAALVEQPLAGGLFSFAAPAPGVAVVPVREAAASELEA